MKQRAVLQNYMALSVSHGWLAMVCLTHVASICETCGRASVIFLRYAEPSARWAGLPSKYTVVSSGHFSGPRCWFRSFSATILLSFAWKRCVRVLSSRWNRSYPEFLEMLQMRNIAQSGYLVGSDIKRIQLRIMVQAFENLQSIMREIKLFKLRKFFEILDFGNTIRLDGQNPELLQSRQSLSFDESLSQIICSYVPLA